MNEFAPVIITAIKQSLADMITENFLYIILTILILIFIFILVREILTWYWKIDERISMLERIETSLIKIEEGVTFLAVKEGFEPAEKDQPNTNTEAINSPTTIQEEVKKNG